jgi:PIN domain nuclease of toxin-antitoxin system
LRLLLDTSTFLFIELDPSKLSQAAFRACKPLANEVFLSTISAWEIALKHASGKLQLPEPPEIYVPSRRKASSIRSLRLEERAVFTLLQLGAVAGHKDPFDRMLVCQAITHGLTIVSPDQAFKRYPVEVLW